VPVEIRPWSESDLPVLERSNEPGMMTHLGGPETAEKLVVRHNRYLDYWGTGAGFMFTIWADDVPEPVGSIGYWLTDEHGTPELETGWSVHLPHQGHGYAAAALKLLVEYAAKHSDRRYIRAYPGIQNTASNAVARRAGFTLVREFDGEYPPGNPVRLNDWVFDLDTLRPAPTPPV
jgi:RimJ/RimL family protein N-acetyltransferase